MFKCKECGKEFSDWHALGGHMRTHWGKREGSAAGRKREQAVRATVEDALGRLGELSAEEGWQIVVNWIMDVYQQAREQEEVIRAYRLRAREGEARIEAAQSELKRLQGMVGDGEIYRERANRL